ncbi:hypothetical protein N7457_005680 [Penicillium paradoxum]|uniref:uncharacterized protein n=1 Tax=Penicillium paradoxum TaxID=176176 RepID=UPI0025492B3E|nr:uncharacterized protein N7457_005680 [Penicillium paradoxum]KAJ5780520.1 hypothetical protein N7457_005680 [Penicillium paradoxum]
MASASAADELFSDDSSFYGDETVKKQLEAQAAAYDPEPFWVQTHEIMLATIQNNLRNPRGPCRDDSSDVSMRDASPEPATGHCNQRGKTEPVERFLLRLPPSTTKVADVGPWIWMFNPHGSSRRSGDIPTLLRKGRELLLQYEHESVVLRKAHDESGAKTTAPLTRKLNPMRKELERNILDLGRETGVTDGKWMLFPTVDHVDEVWSTVVKAMEKGELGEAAKVATADGSGNGQSRLICIYTSDFGDTGDVKRVLCKLVDLGLVGRGSRGIYYKCDAFTCLEINSKNEYGLKASMFSSQEVLGWK